MRRGGGKFSVGSIHKVKSCLGESVSEADGPAGRLVEVTREQVDRQTTHIFRDATCASLPLVSSRSNTLYMEHYREEDTETRNKQQGWRTFPTRRGSGVSRCRLAGISLCVV